MTSALHAQRSRVMSQRDVNAVPKYNCGSCKSDRVLLPVTAYWVGFTCLASLPMAHGLHRTFKEQPSTMTSVGLCLGTSELIWLALDTCTGKQGLAPGSFLSSFLFSIDPLQQSAAIRHLSTLDHVNSYPFHPYPLFCALIRRCSP